MTRDENRPLLDGEGEIVMEVKKVGKLRPSTTDLPKRSTSGKKRKKRKIPSPISKTKEAAAADSPMVPLPRMDMEEFQKKHSMSPKALSGPNIHGVHKHATVRKIFSAAAPPHQVVKNRYMGSIEDNVALAAPISPSGIPSPNLGRRYSIRDMAAIFNILDEVRRSEYFVHISGFRH